MAKAWLGYDSTDVFNLDNNFLKNMLPILKEFKEHNMCLWYDPDKKRELTKEEVGFDFRQNDLSS